MNILAKTISNKSKEIFMWSQFFFSIEQRKFNYRRF